jgi:2,4-dienoyl-CoA reductase-like NADH-dependent reductase (Old Yellow Enzyme family)
VLLGGINRLETVQAGLDEGFEFVAMARALLREPDLIRRFQHHEAAESLCIHCNKCMPSIYTGTHCVLVAPEYRPGHRPTGGPDTEPVVPS